MSKNLGIDKTFLFSIITLVVFGFAVFMSASMGLLATNSAEFGSTAFKQAFFGIVLGLLACFVFSKINYKIFKKYALFIFVASFLITLAVFIPHVGARINGAKRWIVIAGLSFQPVAFLNIGFVVYWAAWLSSIKDKVADIKYGLLPLFIILGIIGAILMKQPDNASFLVICVTGVSMFLVAGGKIRDIIIAFFYFTI